MNTVSSYRLAPRRRLAALSAGVCAAALLSAGCVDDYTAAAINNPATHHPIGFGAEPETLFVEVGSSSRGLSANQEADVWRFIERYKAESSGSLRIAAPKSAGGHFAVSQSMRQVETLVNNAGIDPRAVLVTRYAGAGKHGPAVKIDYDRTVAIAPECGDWSDDLGYNRERLPYNNFGCATQRNLALTVANGRDLTAPQQETPRSSERRSATWSEYVGAAGGGSGSSSSAGAPAASAASAAKP